MGLLDSGEGDLGLTGLASGPPAGLARVGDSLAEAAALITGGLRFKVLTCPLVPLPFEVEDNFRYEATLGSVASDVGLSEPFVTRELELEAALTEFELEVDSKIRLQFLTVSGFGSSGSARTRPNGRALLVEGAGMTSLLAIKSVAVEPWDDTVDVV